MTTGDAPVVHHHVKPPVDPALLEHRNLRGGEFWHEIPAYEDVTRRVPRSQVAGEASRSKRPKAVRDGRRARRPTFLEDASAGSPRAHGVRVSPYACRSIDWNIPTTIRSAASSSRSLALLPDHPRLGPRLAARAGRQPVQGSRTATSTRRCSWRSRPARSTAASARAATRSASTPRRSKSSAQAKTPIAGSKRSRTSRRAPSSRTS